MTTQVIDRQIEELEAQLEQLKQEKELAQQKTEALQEVKQFVTNKLADAELHIVDFLALFEKDVLKYQKQSQKKPRKHTKPTVRTVVTVPGVGHFEIGMRGKLPDVLKTYMENSNLDRQGLIEKYSV